MTIKNPQSALHCHCTVLRRIGKDLVCAKYCWKCWRAHGDNHNLLWPDLSTSTWAQHCHNHLHKFVGTMTGLIIYKLIFRYLRSKHLYLFSFNFCNTIKKPPFIISIFSRWHIYIIQKIYCSNIIFAVLFSLSNIYIQPFSVSGRAGATRPTCQYQTGQLLVEISTPSNSNRRYTLQLSDSQLTSNMLTKYI